MKDKLPKNLSLIGDVMSNFNHEIEDGAEEELKAGSVYGTYPGGSFYAEVWWEERFKAAIYQYGSRTDILESDTLQGIMNKACELYGDS